MSLVSTLASTLYAALPEQVRHPSPRKSEGAREFDALLADEMSHDPLSSEVSFDGMVATVTRMPAEAPNHAVWLRAHY